MNFGKIGELFDKNGASVCTLGSIILTGLSVYFAIKKADEGSVAKASYIVDKELLEEKPIADRKPDDELMIKISYGKDIARAYKESLVCAGGAIILAYASNRINGKKIAGLAATLALNEDKIRKLYSAANKKFGAGAKEKLIEQMAEDDCPFDEAIEEGRHRYRKEPIEVFYESYTGTKFESTGRDVDAAIARAMKRCSNERGRLNFNKWRALLGLPDVPAGGAEFNNMHPFEPYMKMIMLDGHSVIGIFYENEPVAVR